MEKEPNIECVKLKHKKSRKFSLRNLKVSLKYRPKVFRLILKLRENIRKKNQIIHKIQRSLPKKVQHTQDAICQTEEIQEMRVELKGTTAWSVNEKNGETEKSLAEQVKEAAQSALAETGMVYVESAGMYYDYKTGYYYNSELGLYYHPDTGCYYTYSEDKQEFAFHSYPDMNKCAASSALLKHEKKKAKKHKQEKEETLINEENKSKRKKGDKKTKEKESENSTNEGKKRKHKKKNNDSDKKEIVDEKNEKTDEIEEVNNDLEDGECTDTSQSDEESGVSTSTESDDESVAKHHPPCMRVIVRETKLPKLKVGSLFLITKDGGTIGREGENHTILLKEHNVSRNHLEIIYDETRRVYVAKDLGSKNGTTLNGNRMSESQIVSPPVEVPHGSTIQLGVTKLLCHIHPGNDTCGHCEPGLIMGAEEKEKKVAYTRTCSVQIQHQLELARLKNKYGPQPLAIEEGNYNDRAKARREAVGSSHESEKTQQTDLDTCITAENKGFQLLKKMGWSKGEGLGKDSQGETEPIPLVNNESKVGLGAAGSAAPVTIGAIGSVPMKMNKRNKMLRPPARLFRDPLEEDD